MNQEQDYDAKGNPIYRHTQESDDSGVASSCRYLDEITAHLENHIGDVHLIFHEIISEFVHIDVLWIKPTADYPYNVLVTSGMSDKPMHLPDGIEGKENWQYGELMVILPADWKISDEDFEDDKNYWPVHFLKLIARLPHQYNTWVGYGHTIPNGEEAYPFAENTRLGCMMALPPYVSFNEEFLQFKAEDGNLINFYALVPLYKEEMEYKMTEGADALLDLFDEYNIDEVITLDRPNVCLS